MSGLSGDNSGSPLSNLASETLQLYSLVVGDEQLEIEGEGGDSLKLTNKALRNGTRENDIRHFSLRRDVVLLYYTIAPNIDLAQIWNVGVIYGSGSTRETICYPLHGEQDAFRFQRLVTGYMPLRRFQEVTASALEQHLAPNKQATVINLTGEVQLWGVAQQPEMQPLRATRTGSSGGSWSQSILSLASTLSGVSIQRDNKGRQMAVTKTKAPPLLVMFAKREATNGEKELFQMMRVDVTNLAYRDSPNGPTHLTLYSPSTPKSTASGQKVDAPKQKFEVYDLATQQIVSWNLCHLRPRVYSDHFVRHECKDLNLNFRNEENVTSFKKDIMKLRASALGIRLGDPPSSGRRGSSSGAAMSGAPPVADDPSLRNLSPGLDDDRGYTIYEKPEVDDDRGYRIYEKPEVDDDRGYTIDESLHAA